MAGRPLEVPLAPLKLVGAQVPGCPGPLGVTARRLNALIAMKIWQQPKVVGRHHNVF